MTENKKQHYVPQFYLNNFSYNKHVYIYDITHKRKFNISIKNLCQEKYFYGSDIRLEKSLSTIEGKQSKIMKELIKNISILSFKLEDLYYLYLFILMSLSRTKKSSEKMDELINIEYDQKVKPLLKKKDIHLKM